MSFGIQVDTTRGLVNLAEVMTVRFLGEFTVTTRSGTHTPPSGTSSIYVEPRGSNLFIGVRLSSGQLIWDESTSSADNNIENYVMFFGDNV